MMSLANFQYGIGAVILPGQQETFNKLKNQLIQDTRPATFTEQLIVDQLLHAQWELHRVRSLSNHTQAEPTLNAAFARANRNWQRATRELAALQSARAALDLCCEPNEPVAPPLANLAKVPKTKSATKNFQQWKDGILDDGYQGPEYFDKFFTPETEAA